MTTLFSPVGTADPITQLGDGPMLHIVRRLKPDKVVLYLSPKMDAYQMLDQRYTKSIELLAAKCGMPVPELQLISSDIKEVHRFDLYISEFERILGRLSDTDDELLVNVSSGTAGMAQALVALGSFGRLKLKLLQVSTPKRDTNSRFDREDPDEYDLDVMWEIDCEIEDAGENRIAIVQSPNFSEHLLKENIGALCHGFEFEAALKLCKGKAFVSERAEQMIEAAAARLNLEGGMPAKVFAGTELKYSPNDLLVEYLYVMEARLAQGHWAEFIRSLSPALTVLLKKYLSLDLPEGKYVLPKNKRSYKSAGDKYNVEAIQSDKRLAAILERHHYRTSFFVNNAALMELVNEYCKDKSAARDLRRLRRAEEKSRNSLAHSLRASSRDAIEKECAITLDEIMSLLFKLHGSASPGLYGRIAQAIDVEL